MLAHLMIGSEGTLGFISEITYRTVPEYAVQGERADPVRRSGDRVSRRDALKRRRSPPWSSLDRAALRSVEDKPGMPEALRTLPADGAALLVETRAADAGMRSPRRSTRSKRCSAAFHTSEPVRFSTDPQECARCWNVRKGMFPSVGAMRDVGTTVIIEDVAFPVARLAEATLDLQRLLPQHGYRRRDHLRPRARRQPALRLHAGFQRRVRGRALPRLHGRAVPDGRRRSTTARSRPSTAPAATSRPFVELEWGARGVRD